MTPRFFLLPFALCATALTLALPAGASAAPKHRAGEVIVSAAGVPVRDAQDVMEALVGKVPGQRVVLEVVSTAGEKRRVLVGLGSR